MQSITSLALGLRRFLIVALLLCLAVPGKAASSIGKSGQNGPSSSVKIRFVSLQFVTGNHMEKNNKGDFHFSGNNLTAPDWSVDGKRNPIWQVMFQQVTVQLNFIVVSAPTNSVTLDITGAGDPTLQDLQFHAVSTMGLGQQHLQITSSTTVESAVDMFGATKWLANGGLITWTFKSVSGNQQQLVTQFQTNHVMFRILGTPNEPFPQSYYGTTYWRMNRATTWAAKANSIDPLQIMAAFMMQGYGKRTAPPGQAWLVPDGTASGNPAKFYDCISIARWCFKASNQIGIASYGNTSYEYVVLYAKDMNPYTASAANNVIEGGVGDGGLNDPKNQPGYPGQPLWHLTLLERTVKPHAIRCAPSQCNAFEACIKVTRWDNVGHETTLYIPGGLFGSNGRPIICSSKEQALHETMRCLAWVQVDPENPSSVLIQKKYPEYPPN